MARNPLIEVTDNGIFVPDAGVHIDPRRGVERAIVTHAHSDHARRGSFHYLAHHLAAPVLRLRLGENVPVEGIAYGEVRSIRGVQFSLHPAGHVPGSAQVRIERDGEVCVVAGDYKIEDDGVSTPYEPVRCHTFVTESTFGLPMFRWSAQASIFSDLEEWWSANQEASRASIVLAYALGKAQRILGNINFERGPIFVDDSIGDVNDALRGAGLVLRNVERLHPKIPYEVLSRSLIIAPRSFLKTRWLETRCSYAVAGASGWMALRGSPQRQGLQKGFVISDHADFEGLTWAVKESGAERVLVTHGYSDAFARWLRKLGYDAHELHARPTGAIQCELC